MTHTSINTKTLGNNALAELLYQIIKMPEQGENGTGKDAIYNLLKNIPQEKRNKDLTLMIARIEKSHQQINAILNPAQNNGVAQIDQETLSNHIRLNLNILSKVTNPDFILNYIQQIPCDNIYWFQAITRQKDVIIQVINHLEHKKPQLYVSKKMKSY